MPRTCPSHAPPLYAQFIARKPKPQEQEQGGADLVEPCNLIFASGSIIAFQGDSKIAVSLEIHFFPHFFLFSRAGSILQENRGLIDWNDR